MCFVLYSVINLFNLGNYYAILFQLVINQQYFYNFFKYQPVRENNIDIFLYVLSYFKLLNFYQKQRKHLIRFY